MKKRFRTLMALFAGFLFLSLGAGQGLTAEKGNPNDTLHRDGSAFVKESVIIQSDRQAAADRARAKGFRNPNRGNPAKSDTITPTDRGAKK